MYEVIFVILFAIAVGVIFYKVGYWRGDNEAYWRGRGEGWRDCEGMIYDRAKESDKYDHEQLFTDLIQ